MISFSRRISEVFPTEIGGCGIDPSFRNIVRIMRIMADGELTERARMVYAVRYFYTGAIPENGLALMMDFIRAGAEPEDGREPQQMDFEFDADEIYADFLREYRIDLLADDLHWYRFLALLRGLTDKSALSRKMQLRTLDTSKMKGKDRADAEKAKARVQIPRRLTAGEIREAEEFEEIWGRL